MNYQTFSNLQFRPLLKNVFLGDHFDFRDTSGERIRFVSVGITRLVLILEKLPTIISNLKMLQDGCFKTSRASIL